MSDRWRVLLEGYCKPWSEGGAGGSALAENIQQALAVIDRLQGIVNRLPMTEDGVRVLPGDRVFWRHGGWTTVGVDVVGYAKGRVLSGLYSTRESAEAGGE